MRRNLVQQGFTGMIIFAVLLLSGCAVVGLFSKDQTSGVHAVWEIDSPPGDLLQVIAETGKSMGMDVNYWEVRNPPPGFEYWETKSPPPADENDVRSSSILLSDNELGGAKAVFIGKHNVSGLTFYARHGGKRLEVYATVAGNFGSGSQEAAENLLKDFRTKLAQRIGEIKVIQEVPLALFSPLRHWAA